jgi:hypothetical protein
VFVEEPTYVFLTAYSTINFKDYIFKSFGIANVFDKPLQVEQLSEILKTVD